MQPQTALILKIRDELETRFPDIGVALTELSDDGRIYLEIGAGITEKKYVRGPALFSIPILFLIKRPEREEAECLENLSEICNYYQKSRKSPADESYQGRGLEVATGPNKAARYEDGQVLYSCIINFKISY